ncbi:MAG: hypothetical protein II393_04865 [Cytophagales bacterium]|nr:hypothetical protein [Cytophagales bacterium]
MSTKIEPKEIIRAYQDGQSLHSIARAFGTYPTTVKRILIRNNIELRSTSTRGELLVNDGEKLIEWAKAQGRLVSKAELAKVAGTKRLSPSYFIKYPELGQYVKSYEQKELLKYTEQLFKWLKDNNILYKPNDKTALEGISVQALLLGEYEGMIIVLDIKPYSMSQKRYNEIIRRRLVKANEKGLIVLFLKEEHFEDLDSIKELLDSLKYSKER